MSSSEGDPPPSLGTRILGETARFAALQVFASALAWVANVILARLLLRRDFGVYDICTVYIGVGAVLGDGGLGATLLRRKDAVTRGEYRVALTSLVAVSGLLSVVMFVAAGWIGAHNHMTTAETNVLRAMAPLYLVGAFRLVPYIRLERELQFARIARIELASSLVRHVLAIAVAIDHGGVWALVISNVVSSVLQLVLAYRASPGWVGFGWSWSEFRPLIAYGSKVQALGILSYLKDNLAPALLGGVLGPGAVGVFDFGLKYIQVPVTAVNSLARVQLPVYARLDAHDPTLFNALRGAIRTAMVFGIPMLAALALVAPWVVPFLYGAKWAAAFPVIWALVANMVGGLAASPLFTLLQGQGRAGLAIVVFTVWTVVTWVLAILSVAFFPGSLGAVALAHSIVTVVVVLGLLEWAGRHLGRGLFGSLVVPLFAGLAGLGAGHAVRRWASGAAGHPVTAAGVCLVVYAGVLLALERRLVLDELRAIIASVRKRGSNASDPPASAGVKSAA
jgi:O-antigen/teichoic acid export membrane protein